MSRRVLVCGAGGGIGRALTDALAARADVQRVYALHRHAVTSTDDKVVWLQATLDDEAALRAAARTIRGDGDLDGIIAATGLLHGPGLDPEKSISAVSADNLMTLYAANAIGPLLLAKTCHHLLRRSDPPSYLCFLSAQVGSIGDNRLGGWYGYRMAKAALNMGVRSLAVEIGRAANGPLVVAMHPGTTRTALSAPFVRRRRAPVSSPRHSARRILSVLDGLTADHQGSFLNYDGERLPW